MSRLLIAAAVMTVCVSPRAQEPTLEEVLARAGAYVVDYQNRLAGVVSEEHYQQIWEKEPGNIAEQRELRSDVLLTKPEGGKRAILFRDVFEVDGRAVRDRDERLTQLFLSPSASASTQIVRIISESARYNIGDIQRTINTPMLALVFLDPQYQARFRFERSDDRIPETLRDAAVEQDDSSPGYVAAPELNVNSYQETDRNTLIGTGNGTALPSRGRYWIEPMTGQVVMSELVLADPTLYALVDVRYASQSGVDVVVPVAMRERYRKPRSRAVIEGSAAYTRFRRFQVTSTETVADPAPPGGAK
jgi:hypothetical protein